MFTGPCTVPLCLSGQSGSSWPAQSTDYFILILPHGTAPHFAVIELFSQLGKGLAG